ncbi:ABC transporter permease subunit [Hyphomicrobiales bacterium]|nr:ABC transporter permease subunit [Hyphomicrobiales bacterium]CAH1693491.1 conserved membrane hypothetical protein [Hyphomicrobiales bacterium]
MSLTGSLRAPLPRRWQGTLAIQYAVFAVTAIAVLAPLLFVAYQAFIDRPLHQQGAIWTLGNFAALLADEQFREASWNTLIFSVLTAVIAQIIGTVLAILVSRTNLPGRGFVSQVVIWPLFLSHLLMSFGWYLAFGPSGYVTLQLQAWFGDVPWNLYSIAGMAFITGNCQAPLAFLFCIAAARQIDPNLESTARSVGARPLRILTSVTLPLLRPAILYGLTMNFVLAIEALSIPLLFGRPAKIPFFSTFLFEEAINKAQPQYHLVAAAAMLMLAVILVLLAIQKRLVSNGKRFVTVGGKASQPRLFDLGRFRIPVAVAVYGFIFATIILVIGMIVLRSFTVILTPLMPIASVLTLDNYKVLWDNDLYLRSISNTVLVALIGSIIGTAVTIVVTLVAYRSNFSLAPALAVVAQTPRALTGVFGGLAFLYLLLAVPMIGGLRNTIWALVFAYVVRFLPSAIGTILPALNQISQDLDLAARNVGASWWTTCRTIIMPILKLSMLSCVLLLAILMIRDYVTAVFLVAPGSELIGTTILQLWKNGQIDVIAPLATIQIIIVFILVQVSQRVFGVKIYG